MLGGMSRAVLRQLIHENILHFILSFFGDITENDSAYCDACYHSVVCPFECMSSDTLMHPVKVAK